MPDAPNFRPIRPSDLADLTDLTSHWAVVRQLGSWPWPPEPAFTASRCVPTEGPEGFVWAICLDDRLVGTVGVTRGELGYMLHPDWHGKGIAGLAARRAVDHAFADDPGLTVIAGTTWADNRASARLLARLGFVHWQAHFAAARARGVPTLLFRHRLTREDWARQGHC